ncbi:hypothetical protein [Ramlibacter humi]|uniref:Uncharacterized protein n=1 Tax=Ramlibacter humi TaxID=2530451 RepID=A0A4Z0CBP0_9BURK|nr:hypothetical protein [Ramlibacter humi]TFZ08312.1 hypothetical protein EZ216_03900 [Ramlibacter humi]
MDRPDDPDPQRKPILATDRRRPAPRRERSGRGSASALQSLRELERDWEWYEAPAAPSDDKKKG